MVADAGSPLEHSGHALQHIEDEAKRRKTEVKTLMITQRLTLHDKQNIVGHLDEECVKQCDSTRRRREDELQRFDWDH